MPEYRPDVTFGPPSSMPLPDYVQPREMARPMSLPGDYGPAVGPGGINAITREPGDYPSPGTGWQGPVGPGGVGSGPGDYGGFGGFGGFDSFQPMSFGFAGAGGPSEFRPDLAFGGMAQDPRQRLRIGMPRQPFSGGGGGSFVQNRQAASPMMGFNPRGLLQQRSGGASPPGGLGGRVGTMSGGGGLSPGGRRPVGPGGGMGPIGQDDPTHTYLTNTPAGPMPLIYDLVRYGFLGPGAGQGADYGGMFGVNPPSQIMGGVRQRAVQDAGAQERAARLGLQSRGDIDPSTYGFQALQSQLQGQQGVQNALGQADLGLRQQQLQQYWQLLNALLGSHTGIQQSKNQQPSGLGAALGGLGSLAGGIFGGPGGAAAGGSLGGAAGGLFENSGGRYI